MQHKVFALLMIASAAFGADWYASPSGLTVNVGTQAAPWDLQTASNSTLVKPGDRVLLLGSAATPYKAGFAQANMLGCQYVAAVNGTPAATITFLPAPGAHPVIDGNLTGASNKDFPDLCVKGTWETWAGIEFTNSDPIRVITLSDSHNVQRRGDGIAVGLAGQKGTGTGTRLIGNWIHDVGDAVSVDFGADSVQIIGNVCWSIGWDAPDRGHGPCYYLKHGSSDPTKTTYVRGNIAVGTMDDDFRGYGSDPATSPVVNITWQDNIALGAGRLASAGHGAGRQFYAGGGVVATSQTYIGDVSYVPPGAYGVVGFGRDIGCQGLTFNNGWIIGGDVGNYMCTGVTMTGNLILANGQATLSAFPSNTFLAARPTTGTVVKVIGIPEAGKAHVAVLNWGGAASVKVDLSSAGFPDNTALELVDAQNPLGPVLKSFTYNSAADAIDDFPLTAATAYTSIGNVPQPYTHTAPEFQAFIVRPAGGFVAPPVVTPPVVVPPPVVTPPVVVPPVVTPPAAGFTGTKAYVNGVVVFTVPGVLP